MQFLRDLIPVPGRRLVPYMWAITAQIMVILLAIAEDAPGTALIAWLAVIQLALIHVRYQEQSREDLDEARTTITELTGQLRQAHTDPVTALPTRRIAEQHLSAATGTSKTIALIDVDGMHEFNNTHGHDMGDWLLAELARRLSSLLGPGDLAARLGGDEFVVISGQDPAVLAEQIFAALREPPLEGDIVFPASAGICPVGRGNARRALSCADRAMFTAKRRAQDSASRIEVYDPARDGPPSDAARPRVRLRTCHTPDPIAATQPWKDGNDAMSHSPRPIDRGARMVDGVTVTITELIWPDGGRSFEAHRADTGADLTIDGCFDVLPTDDDIRRLLATAVHRWRCPGCTTAVGADDHDLQADHMCDCFPDTNPASRGGQR